MITTPPVTVTDTRHTEIRSALEILRVEPEQVIELRAPEVPQRYGRPATVAGWFDDLDALAAAAVELEDRGATAVYTTLNVVNPALLARACNRLVEHPKATTSDKDIIRRAWLPIDIDPARPAGISSDKAELLLARARALEVAGWLTEQLQAEPAVWAFSGNGWHLLFRADMPNADESTTIVKNIIDGAADRFSDEQVHVDRTVFNAGRIWKLYGTTARKGDQVARLGRVHRRARILGKEFM